MSESMAQRSVDLHKSRGKEEAGSLLDLCSDVLRCARIISPDLQREASAAQLKLLPFYVDQAIRVLSQCQQRFGDEASATIEKAKGLEGCLRGIDKSGKDLLRQLEVLQKWQKQNKQGASLHSLLKRMRSFKSRKPATSATESFQAAEDELKAYLEKLRSIETAGTDHYIFHMWRPDVLSLDELIYLPPVAYDTITSSLLGSTSPSRFLIHGPPGNGKTSLLQELAKSFTTQESTEPSNHLPRRFTSGLVWVECGKSLQISFPQFGLEIRSKALKLARDLGIQGDSLEDQDVSGLAALIKQRLVEKSFLVIFDDVWDGTIFRRGCLDIIPSRSSGPSQLSAVVVASQLNLSSFCQWHSPETLTVPLSNHSNTAACLDLLVALATGSSREALPPAILPIARSIVRDCGGSPLAVRLLAPLLAGSLAEKAWRGLHTRFLSLLDYPSLRRSSLDSPQEADTLRILTAYQLRASTLPTSIQRCLSSILLFPPAQQVPTAALIAVCQQIHSLPFSEVCLAIRSLSNASFLRTSLDSGSLLTGTFAFDVALKEFLERSTSHERPHLPGTPDAEHRLCLAVVIIYGTPAYKQQALQVFSKQQSEDDSCVWEETSRSGRRPYAEAFWLQLLGLCWDPELGASAGVPIASAARSRVSMREMSRALAMLFCDAQSLHAACGVFSELTWQVEDRNFLGQLVSQLQEVKAVSRIIMRLRELTSKADAKGGAEEVATLAWALADLADYLDNSSKMKLQDEPLIPVLEHCYGGAASYAHQRLIESLQVMQWDGSSGS